MRLTKLAIIVGFFGIFSNAVHADQQVLDAYTNAGISMTEEQSSGIQKANCNGDDCTQLINEIVDLISENSGNDIVVESILRTTAGVRPDLIQTISELALDAAPEQIALIAALMLDIVPTAAGPIGLTTLADGNIPTPVTPGNAGNVTNVSSPN